MIMCSRGWGSCCEGSFQVLAGALLAPLLQRAAWEFLVPLPWNCFPWERSLNMQQIWCPFISSLAGSILLFWTNNQAKKKTPHMQKNPSCLFNSIFMLLWRENLNFCGNSVYFLPQKGDRAHKRDVKTIRIPSSLLACSSVHVMGVHSWGSCCVHCLYVSISSFLWRSITIPKPYSRVTVLSLPHCALLLCFFLMPRIQAEEMLSSNALWFDLPETRKE